MWGETKGYTAEQVTGGERAFDDKSYKAKDISTNLTLEQDAAHVHMSGKWRMPTMAEYHELIKKCNVMWTDDYNGTGVKGCIFTSKVNGKSVFFPAAGNCSSQFVGGVGSLANYWSASLSSSSRAWYLYFNSGGQGLDDSYRFYGRSVRGVFK